MKATMDKIDTLMIVARELYSLPVDSQVRSAILDEALTPDLRDKKLIHIARNLCAAYEMTPNVYREQFPPWEEVVAALLYWIANHGNAYPVELYHAMEELFGTKADTDR